MTDGSKNMVWIYVDTNHQVGHPDHLKVFATPEAADEWFQKSYPEGVAFGYELFRMIGFPRGNGHCYESPKPS
jgi:hypothetical protein